jgi:hypothetical protein
VRGSIQYLHNLLSRCTARVPVSIALLVLATAVPASAQTASASSPTLVFTAARVGIPSGSAEVLTETFQLTGYPSLLSPTAALHYGLAYTTSTPTCTGITGNQTCTVTVTFMPNYPGGRRDALFLMSGTTRLATILTYGVGLAPFALIQPGIVTTSIPEASAYLYGSVVDENGTTYILGTEANSVWARTSAGVFTTLPITGLNSPRTIALDGAGVLYFADQTPHGPIITYDTVQHTQGSTPFPTGPFYVQALTVGNTGSLYETDGISIYTVAPSGSTTTTLLNPAITQLEVMAIDSSDNLFLGGYTINELTSGGTQSVVNTVGSQAGLSLDAAGTLYATRYTGSGGVVELPSYSYATNIAALDPAASPLGSSLAPDGTLYVSNYSNFDKVDRSQGAITFKAINSGQSDTETTTLYNGGNLPLTVASVALTGDPDYTLTAPATGTCIANMVLSPGTLCTVSIHLTAPHAGLFTGTLTITTNSLANPAATSTIALTDQVDGAYITTSPASLAFGNQNVGTQSASQTITFSNSGLINSASLSSPTSSNPVFTASIGTCGPALATGSTCTMTVTFSPAAAQAYTGTLTVYPGNGQTLTLALTGTGTAATPTAALTPNPVVFPGVNVYSYSQATITLTNTGTASLTGITPTITGANAADFSIYPSTSCGTTLAAGSNCTYVLHFSPPSAGRFTAVLSVADSATGSPQTTTLTAVGGPAPAAQMQFTPTELNVIAGTGTTPTGCVNPAEPGPALQTQLCGPSAVATDLAGNIYVVEQQDNVVKKLDTSGNITTFAGIENTGAGSYSGDNGPASAANLSQPVSVAIDAAGNVYISDSGNGRIREVNAATGVITTFVGGQTGQYFNGGTGAGVTLSPGGIAFDLTGNLYIAEPTQNIVVKVAATGAATLFAGLQTLGGPGTAGYNGDNILATTAELNAPTSVAVDRAGNIYIADSLNYRIRTVNENAVPGMISTVAGNGTKGDTGDGGTSTAAEITPLSIAINQADDLFISDGATLRKVDGQGNISTFAGGGTGGLGGPATSALLQTVGQPAIDNKGDVLLPLATTPEVLSAGPIGILQFGNQAVGTTSSPLTLTVENTGNNYLNFSQTTYTPTGTFTVTGGTCEGATDGGWQPGSTCTLTLTFTPTAVGAATATLSIPSNATASPASITLQGNGTAAAAPIASLSPSTLSFASTTVGTTTTAQTLTLSNTGNAVLNISGITLGGAAPSDFAETTTCAATLAASATCSISVTFTPTSAASFTASVAVADNAAGSPHTATLTGTGTPAPAPIASLSPSTLSFANTTVGATTPAQKLTLSNTGNAPLTITGITLGGANSTNFAETNTCGATLAASATCTVSVTFTPTAIATDSATITIADNAAGSPQTSTLTGAGIAAPDFTLTASPQAQTVPGGTPATFNITAGSVNGAFSNAITLTATGVPTGATATFLPATITPGSESSTSVLTIQTTTALARLRTHAPWLPVSTLAFCIPLLWWRKRNRQRLLSAGLFCLLLTIAATTLSGCGGGYYAQPPSQTYSITITGTSGSTQHSTTVTLTVQ